MAPRGKKRSKNKNTNTIRKGRSRWIGRSAGRWQKQMRRLPPRRTLLFNVEFAGASPMLIKRHSRACLTSPDGAADPPKQKYVKKFSPFAGQPVKTDFNCELPLGHARNAQSREAASSTLDYMTKSRLSPANSIRIVFASLFLCLFAALPAVATDGIY